MTRLAIGRVNVLIGDDLPVGDVGVAVYTRIEIQVFTERAPRQMGFTFR
jgi:hypothetical protein